MKGKGLTVGFGLNDLLDVKAPPLSVGSGYFALSALEASSHDLDGVSLADGDAPDVVLCLQIFAHVTAHYSPSLR